MMKIPVAGDEVFVVDIQMPPEWGTYNYTIEKKQILKVVDGDYEFQGSQSYSIDCLFWDERSAEAYAKEIFAAEKQRLESALDTVRGLWESL